MSLKPIFIVPIAGVIAVHSQIGTTNKTGNRSPANRQNAYVGYYGNSRNY
jgi:hypothetical protein